MWFKVLMTADDSQEVIVSLNDSEYAAVKKFLSQIKEQRVRYSWVGGHWSISPPCSTKEEAEKFNTRLLWGDD